MRRVFVSTKKLAFGSSLGHVDMIKDKEEGELSSAIRRNRSRKVSWPHTETRTLLITPYLAFDGLLPRLRRTLSKGRTTT